MPSKKVEFTNHLGYRLSAKIDLPLNKGPYPFALFAHVFTGNKSLSAARYISRALTLNGIAVMRFDFTGLGESEGDFADSNFTSNVEDLVAAAEFLESNYRAPSVVVGHSLGGAAALFAANRIDSIQAVATINSPSYPEHVLHLLEDNLEEIDRRGSARVNIGGRHFTIKKQFLDDLRAHDHEKVIPKLKKAILVMHSPQDKVVGIENAAHLYKLAKHPKSFVSLDGSDHLLTEKKDALYAGEVIATWVRRYIDFPERDMLQTFKDVVVKLGDSGYTTEIMAGDHGLVADEPLEVGGSDLGPSPYELLNASLGACTAMTLQMYARRKKWPLEEVKVHLSHSKHIHAEDSRLFENKKSKIDRFERVIEIRGNLSEDQRARLLDIANKCPVHRTLHAPKQFATRLLEDENWAEQFHT